MNQFPSKNYFTLPNEIFSLGLGAGEIAVYAYLRCLENPSTYQCWPSYATIGKATPSVKSVACRVVPHTSKVSLPPSAEMGCCVPSPKTACVDFGSPRQPNGCCWLMLPNGFQPT